jgi:predicted nucleic acid-binding protein
VIVLDASVLIAHLDGTDALHARATTALEAAVRSPIGASTITLAEVMVGPARSGRAAATEAALRELAVEEIPLPVGAAPRLAALRAETALKLPDCCVALAARDASAEGVLTFDDGLARALIRLGLAPVPA